MPNEERKTIPSAALVTGILAHVDAGKTTLSEALLYGSGAIRTFGRVDHGDAFLDTFALEKERGITIFSKQAQLQAKRHRITLLDTPGHADFSPEMERVLGVLDAAILIMSAADGVDGQMRTLWKLLDHYRVPVFIFVNKMDQPGADREKLFLELKEELNAPVVDFGSDLNSDGAQEELAVLDEGLMTRYLEEGIPVGEEDIAGLVSGRKLFPVYFGSALRREGTAELLDGIDRFLKDRFFPETFGARVFKISREEGTRLTWMRITGGTLRPRTSITLPGKDGPLEEKADQLREYSGSRFTLLQEAKAGAVVAVTGLTATKAGQGIGAEKDGETGLLQPIFAASIELPEGDDPFTAYRSLRILEEEEPMLRIVFSKETGELSAYVMGQVQTEVLRRYAYERFGLIIRFGPERIIYKETVRNAVEGVGHYEPLRHYSEVHLYIEPAAPGSGVMLENRCSTDVLARNWQNLIMTHLEEKVHRGVLTGAELTDVKITLLTGAASIKHTVGGDFRQATYRAVRQGLMMAESILLEPVLSLELELPPECVGRALNDISRMGGTIRPVHAREDRTVLSGKVTAAAFGSYAAEVASYSGGRGSVSVSFAGYEPCRNAEEIIESAGYLPDLDGENPPASVFCAHGAGFVVPWDQVREYMHLDTGWRPGAVLRQDGSFAVPDSAGDGESTGETGADYAVSEGYETDRGLQARTSKTPREDRRDFAQRERDRRAFDDELRAIYERTYGPVKNRAAEEREREERRYGLAADEERRAAEAKGPPGGDEKYALKRNKPGRDDETYYLLVDGYNIIYAWQDLHALADSDIMSARDALQDILSNYAGFARENIILVFDAYRVKGDREILRYNNIDVIYTRQAETADLYIEKTAHELSRHYRVSVATSDAIEQVITMRDNYETLSANDLLLRIRRAEEAIRENLGRQVVPAEFRNRPFTPENMGVSADGEGKDKR